MACVPQCMAQNLNQHDVCYSYVVVVPRIVWNAVHVALVQNTPAQQLVFQFVQADNMALCCCVDWSDRYACSTL